jgi:hypothetical protein
MGTQPVTFQEEGRFEANPNDLFITPLPLCRYALSLIQREGKMDIFEPGVGTGNWGKAAHEKWPKAWVEGVDIVEYPGARANYDSYWVGDVLKHPLIHYDVIIGNPPFTSTDNKTLAEQIILKCLDALGVGGEMLLFLKTEYINTDARFQRIFKERAPRYIHTLNPPRVGWRLNKKGKKGTNTTDYSLFHWVDGNSTIYPQVVFAQEDWRTYVQPQG